jgi:hypothetical protein
MEIRLAGQTINNGVPLRVPIMGESSLFMLIRRSYLSYAISPELVSTLLLVSFASPGREFLMQIKAEMNLNKTVHHTQKMHIRKHIRFTHATGDQGMGMRIRDFISWMRGTVL